MKTAALLLALVGAVVAEEVVVDESGVSLLQHSVRTIRKADEVVDDPPGPPPAGVAERLANRRAQRRARRQEGRAEAQQHLSPEQIERRRARRMAKRQAKRAAHEAGTAHFNDGGVCDTCAAKCTAIFDDEFKECLVREQCRPWLKEDGHAADTCQRRCDRAANWLREPCIRDCNCDVDLLGTVSTEKASKTIKQHGRWAEGHHRCRVVPLGSMSTCTSIAEHQGSTQYDSIKKCAKAAVQSGANTFNFYRTSKEYAKCSLRQCNGDLEVAVAPREAEAPAGRGNWKVFSTLCTAPAAEDRSETGPDEGSR